MRVNQATLDLIKRFEGWRSTAYRDAAGVWTIGYGHTSAAGRPEVKPGMKITREQGEEILRRDVGKFSAGVEALVKVPLSENQFGALLSFTYNVGLGNFKKSSVLRVVNAGQLFRVPDRLALWNKAGGRVLKGLVRRRGEEGELFAREDDEAAANASGFNNYDEQPDSSPMGLQFQSKGEPVKFLQRHMNRLGYFSGTVDGKFGTRTRAAVLAFQADNQLVTDGIAGAVTLKALSGANPREISEPRASTTLTSLAEGGSRIADASFKSSSAGAAASGIGLAGMVSQYSGTFQTLKNQIEPVAAPFGGLTTLMLIALLGVVGFMTWQAIRAGRARTQDQRTGKTS